MSDCKETVCFSHGQEDHEKFDKEATLREFTLKFQKLLAHLQMLSNLDVESFDTMYKTFADMCADISKSAEGLDKLREVISKFADQEPEDGDFHGGQLREDEDDDGEQ